MMDKYQILNIVNNNYELTLCSRKCQIADKNTEIIAFIVFGDACPYTRLII